MPKSPKKLSNVMVWLLILLSYIPILTLFAFMDQTRSFMYAVTGFWLLVFLLLKIPRTHIPSIKKSQSKIISYSVFIFLGIAVLFLIYKYLGFTFNFDLTKVYEIRKVYTEMKIPLAGYLFNWQAYIIIPVFFALFLIKRKWIPIILIVLLQIFLFSSTGNKTFLFAIPFVLVLMWIVTRKNPIALMSIGLIGIILLGMLSYYTIDDVWVSSLFARRTLLTPAQVSFFYYDFFSKNGPTFLSQHHLFRNFIDYPYHLNPPRLIASVYFDKPDMNANNGIYADAFMNFGFWGFILWGVLLTVILKSIDSFSKNKDLKITIATIAIPTIFLTNSALLTCFLTHGLLLSLLLLYLLPKESKTQKI
jgi:oligosaccharide repeat unit polymerase